KMKKILLLIGLLIIGCSDNEQNDNLQEDERINVRIEITGSGHSSSISLYHTRADEGLTEEGVILNEGSITIPYEKNLSLDKYLTGGDIRVRFTTYTCNRVEKLNLYINGEKVC